MAFLQREIVELSDAYYSLSDGERSVQENKLGQGAVTKAAKFDWLHSGKLMITLSYSDALCSLNPNGTNSLNRR